MAKTKTKKTTKKKPERHVTKSNTEKMSVSVPAGIAKTMAKHIDGVTIRSRSHLITIALSEWLESHSN